MAPGLPEADQTRRRRMPDPERTGRAGARAAPTMRATAAEPDHDTIVSTLSPKRRRASSHAPPRPPSPCGSTLMISAPGSPRVIGERAERRLVLEQLLLALHLLDLDLHGGDAVLHREDVGHVVGLGQHRLQPIPRRHERGQAGFEVGELRGDVGALGGHRLHVAELAEVGEQLVEAVARHPHGDRAAGRLARLAGGRLGDVAAERRSSAP